MITWSDVGKFFFIAKSVNIRCIPRQKRFCKRNLFFILTAGTGRHLSSALLEKRLNHLIGGESPWWKRMCKEKCCQDAGVAHSMTALTSVHDTRTCVTLLKLRNVWSVTRGSAEHKRLLLNSVFLRNVNGLVFSSYNDVVRLSARQICSEWERSKGQKGQRTALISI